MYRVLSFCLALGFVVSMGGCAADNSGPALVKATGIVNYQGKPISGAILTMVSSEGHMSTGTTNAQGKFSMTTGGRPGVPVGSAKVGVMKMSTPSIERPADPKPEDLAKISVKGGLAPEAVSKPEIPQKYAIPAKSGLVADVSKDPVSNVFEFNLVD